MTINRSRCNHVLPRHVQTYFAINQKKPHLSSIPLLQQCRGCRESLGLCVFSCLTCLHTACSEHLAHDQQQPGGGDHLTFYSLSCDTFFCLKCGITLTKEAFFLSLSGAPTSSLYASPPKGLLNLGNTCFLNAVLQVFLNSQWIQRILSDGVFYSMHCRRGRAASKRGCITCDFEELFTRYHSPSDSSPPLAPHLLLQSLWSSAKTLSGYSQHDSHEFLITLLNDMHLHYAAATPPAHPSACNCPIHATFGGELLSIVTCNDCNSDSVSKEPFFDLSIDVPNQPSPTIESCLGSFTRAEHLPTSQYLCNRCSRQATGCRKRIEITNFRHNLILHLKRFSRLGQPPAIPLILTHGERFHLAAVVSHLAASGEHGGGHYICFVRQPQSSCWLRIDDAAVQRVPYSSSLFSDAYLLFYEK